MKLGIKDVGILVGCWVIALGLAIGSPQIAARAQAFNEAKGVAPSPPPGGPVAVGVAQAQVDPTTQKVAIVTAAVPEQKGGGFIQLSAFGWLEPYVDSAAQALIVAFMGWFVKTQIGQKLDQNGRDALEAFAKNTASSLIADGAVRIKDKAVHVDSDFLLREANSASTRIPDALKRFGLTPDVVANKIVDAIPQTAAGAQMIAEAHASAPQVPPVAIPRPPGGPEPAFTPPVSGAS